MIKLTTPLTLFFLQMANAQTPPSCDDNYDPARWLNKNSRHGQRLPTPCVDPNLDPNEDCDCYEEGFVDWEGMCG